MIRKLLCLLGFHMWEDITHPLWKKIHAKKERCKHCHKCRWDW